MSSDEAFEKWYYENMGDGSNSVAPETWIAIDRNNAIIGQDKNGNALLDRLRPRPDLDEIRILYNFPREFL